MSESLYISGERIYLRQVRIDDVNQTYCAWLSDPEVTQYMEVRFSTHSISSIKQYVQDLGGDRQFVFLAICMKETKNHIGNIKLGPINHIHRFADISLFIGEKKYWGKGLATEAISILTEFAFDQLNLNKVMAGCYENNFGSKRAFEKAGFAREGVLKKMYLCRDTYVDGLVFCLLKEVWLKSKRKNNENRH